MIRYIVTFFFSISSLFASGHTALKAVDLKCDQEVNPLGIDVLTPALQWRLSTGERGVMQTAYKVLVSDNLAALQKHEGNVWNSGKVESAQSIQVKYKGRPLEPTKRYFWKVMVWDNKGHVTPWSEVGTWRMGLLTEKDWKGAKWIAYEELPDSLQILPKRPVKGERKIVPINNVLPLVRKIFAVKKTLKNATLFISGLGHFEASLNGNKIGDHFLDPGWTNYTKHALYVTFDIKDQLQKGNNALGVMLGNGFYHIPPARYKKLTTSYGYPKMICRVLLEYIDGTKEDIVSDGSWKTAPGPITFTSIYGGEDYDANLEQKGWDLVAFKESASWKPVVVTNGPELESQRSTPLKVFENLATKKITQPKPGVWIYDLGQNASGIIQLTVKGKKGDTIKITPSELLDKEGLATQRATGAPYYFKYTLKGDGTEVWQPRFSYYGFRYLQVEGGTPNGETNQQGQPVVTALKGLHTRNAVERIGELSSSSDLFNKTNKLIDWATKSNMSHVFTDCPHREKLGWLEQVHLMGTSIQYNYDIARVGKKIIRDMQMAQTEEGLIPAVAPEFTIFSGDFRDSPEWGSSAIIFPWYMYKWYGDKQVLEESYPMMQKYIRYLKNKSKDNILKFGLSDWYDLGPGKPAFSQLTQKGVTSTATFYYDLGIMSTIAKILGKTEDATLYENLMKEVKDAFNKAYFNPTTKQYSTGSQAANSMAVFMKLVNAEYKDSVVANIVKDLRGRNNALTAGDVGYRYLLKVLDDEGRSDVIYDMNNRSDVAGYGFQLKKGATALTESWRADPSVSNNHLMLGHLMEWFYAGLAGISAAEDAVAFNNINIRPQPVGDITAAKASYQSPYGIIMSDWKKQDKAFEITVQVPANSVATVYLPATKSSKIMEDGKSLQNRSNVTLAGYEGDKALIKIGSGNYKFTVNN